ncbi:type II toxin-antitoxin system RelE/ParE family toxin [Mycobacterium sp. SA01]|uniref:type II toxin-antitoxin system RelE family toxin n=1 Tax=Mycobacterium sp. SA01 TaxID=3238820 RepID=UPI00351AB6D7
MASGYSIEIETSAAKALTRIERPFRIKIINAIADLGMDPRPHGCTKLSGRTDAYRIRIADYRVIYTINDGIRVVRVQKIAHRREVYR